MDPLTEEGFVESRLGYHPASDRTAKQHAAVREAAMAFAREIVRLVPGSPERTLAFRAAQEAMMWANAAIAIHGGVPVAEDASRVH